MPGAVLALAFERDERMPPKRKSPADLDGSDAEFGAHATTHLDEGESIAPKKRGRKSIIDAILQEEGISVAPISLFRILA